MREYLPPDDEKTRKNPLYRNLFEEFDKIDGRPARGRLSRPPQGIPPPSRRAGPSRITQSEIEALQAKINDLRRQEAGTARAAHSTLQSDFSAVMQSITSILDKTCIFV